MARRWLWIVVVAAVLAGCGTRVDGEGAPGGDDTDRLHQQARDALARYDQAVHDAGGRRPSPPSAR